MVKSLTLKNFTVFEEAEFEFGGLNVIVGENGTGKSHVLKVIYALLWAGAKAGREGNGPTASVRGLEGVVLNKLYGVFHAERLAGFVTHWATERRCEFGVHFGDNQGDLTATIADLGNDESLALERVSGWWVPVPPVFLPPGELLSFYPGFVAAVESYHLEFDETWRDTCVLLGGAAVRGSREERASRLAQPLLDAMGAGGVVKSQDRFFLEVPTRGQRFDMHMVAEGWRKLAMLVQLILNGALLDEGYLIWDEPDANLNSALTKHVAKAVLDLSASGVQVWVATHSLFLMREIDILLATPAYNQLPARFFGLHHGEKGVSVRQSDSVDDIGDIAALNEDLSQSGRYLRME